MDSPSWKHRWLHSADGQALYTAIDVYAEDEAVPRGMVEPLPHELEGAPF